MSKEVYSTIELSDVLGVPESTIRLWRSRGDGPPYIRLGRHVRYRAVDVQEFLASQAVAS